MALNLKIISARRKKSEKEETGIFAPRALVDQAQRVSEKRGNHRISSIKRRSVYLTLRRSGARFISKIKIEENEIIFQLKTISLKPWGVKL